MAKYSDKRRKKFAVFLMISTLTLSLILLSQFLIVLSSPGTAENSSANLRVQESVSPPISQWNRSWGYEDTDEATSIAVDGDAIYMVGHIYYGLSIPLDAFIAKYNSTGHLLWEHIYNSSYEDRAFGVVVDTTGNVYMAGYSYNVATDFDVLLVKYSSAGTQLWNFTWDSGMAGVDKATSLAIDSSNNLYVAGTTENTTKGNKDSLLLKIAPDKTILWTETWIGDTGDDQANDILIDGNDIYIVGQTTSFGVGTDALIAKYDLFGNLIWSSTWGGLAQDICYSVALDSSQNLIMVGDTQSFGAGSYDILIMKYTNTGTLLWNLTLGNSLVNHGYGVAVDVCNYILLVGITDQAGKISLFDGFMAILDPDGHQLLNMTLGTMSGNDKSNDVLLRSNITYVVGQTYNVSGSTNDAILFKFETNFPTCNGGNGGIPGFQLSWIFLTLVPLFAIISILIKPKRICLEIN